MPAGEPREQSPLNDAGEVARALQQIAILESPLERVTRLSALLDRLETEQEGRHSGPVWRRLFTDSIAPDHVDLEQRGWLIAGTGKIKAPGNDPWALLSVARLLQLSGAEVPALEALEQAQRLRPGNLLIMLWRAHGLARLGRLEQADALFEQVGRRFSEPARITRMGSRGWNWVLATHFEPETDAAWEWLVRPPEDLRTLLLVSVDGRYWLHYGRRLLESWTAATRNDGDAAALHVHLINADAATQRQAMQLAQANCRVSLCHERLALPVVTEDHSGRTAPDHATWFACKRLLVLPWWLDRVQEGVVLTDVDTVWHGNPSRLWPALRCGEYPADAGGVALHKGMLWEDWYLTLSVFRATDHARAVARDAAAYVQRFLSQGEGVWLLDQTALWSTFERHHWRNSHSADHAGPRIAALPDDWVDWGNGPPKKTAVLWTSLASQEHADIAATHQAWQASDV